MNYHLLPESNYEFEFLFFHSDEPFYVLHEVDHFEVDISNIKEWNITKL